MKKKILSSLSLQSQLSRWPSDLSVISSMLKQQTEQPFKERE
ncbi:hypothetical protein [Listeria grayi]|nr:hypothetical protein [Listeria grayi]